MEMDFSILYRVVVCGYICLVYVCIPINVCPIQYRMTKWNWEKIKLFLNKSTKISGNGLFRMEVDFFLFKIKMEMDFVIFYRVVVCGYICFVYVCIPIHVSPIHFPLVVRWLPHQPATKKIIKQSKNNDK